MGAQKAPAPLKFPATGKLKTHWQKAVQLAQMLPEVVEDRSYGTPALKVKGKLIARLRSEAEGGLAIRCDFVDRNMLVQADPETFYVTPHYENYPMVLVNLGNVRWDAMPALLEAAWRKVAPKKLISTFDA